MEHLAHSFTLHSASPETGTFRGMASVFNTLIDTWMPTRIKRGAFTNTLRTNGHRVKVLYQHNPDLPIGLPTKMEETERGLYVEAKISPTSLGKDVLQLLKDKVITELSIGFDPVRAEMVTETIDGLSVQVRHVTEVQLWEFSPVTFAANRDALVTSVHRRGSQGRIRQQQQADDLTMQYVDSELRNLEREWNHADHGRSSLRDVVRDARRAAAHRDDTLRQLQLKVALLGVDVDKRR